MYMYLQLKHQLKMANLQLQKQAWFEQHLHFEGYKLEPVNNRETSCQRTEYSRTSIIQPSILIILIVTNFIVI